MVTTLEAVTPGADGSVFALVNSRVDATAAHPVSVLRIAADGADLGRQALDGICDGVDMVRSDQGDTVILARACAAPAGDPTAILVDMGRGEGRREMQIVARLEHLDPKRVLATGPGKFIVLGTTQCAVDIKCASVFEIGQ